MIKILPLPIKENDKKYFSSDPANYRNIMAEIFTAHGARATADDVAEVEALGEIISFAVTHIYRNLEKRADINKLATEHNEFYNYVAYRLLDAFSYRCDDGNFLDNIVTIISLFETRLESIGYDEEKRQELYQAVNEKNRKCGYLENAKMSDFKSVKFCEKNAAGYSYRADGVEGVSVDPDTPCASIESRSGDSYGYAELKDVEKFIGYTEDNEEIWIKLFDNMHLEN